MYVLYIFFHSDPYQDPPSREFFFFSIDRDGDIALYRSESVSETISSFTYSLY